MAKGAQSKWSKCWWAQVDKKRIFLILFTFSLEKEKKTATEQKYLFKISKTKDHSIQQFIYFLKRFFNFSILLSRSNLLRFQPTIFVRVIFEAAKLIDQVLDKRQLCLFLFFNWLLFATLRKTFYEDLREKNDDDVNDVSDARVGVQAVDFTCSSRCRFWRCRRSRPCPEWPRRPGDAWGIFSGEDTGIVSWCWPRRLSVGWGSSGHWRGYRAPFAGTEFSKRNRDLSLELSVLGDQGSYAV